MINCQSRMWHAADANPLGGLSELRGTMYIEDCLDYCSNIINVDEAKNELKQMQGRINSLETFGRMLVEKINDVITNQDYYAVWSTAQIHRGPYLGPRFDKELADFVFVLYPEAAQQAGAADRDPGAIATTENQSGG